MQDRRPEGLGNAGVSDKVSRLRVLAMPYVNFGSEK